MTITCADCRLPTKLYWNFNRRSVCGSCAGMRDQQAMMKANEYKLYMDDNSVRNAAGSFKLPATIKKGTGDTFPNINTIQVVFDNSVWGGVLSWDNVEGAVLLKRTKKKYLPNGEEI